MCMNYFIIDTQLPSLNDYIHKMNNHHQTGAKFKRDVEEEISGYILLAKAQRTLTPVTEYPVELNIEWHEKGEKRDVDNIKSAAKFILDAMKNSGIIKDDGRRYVSQIYDVIVNDKKTFVKVKITNQKN